MTSETYAYELFPFENHCRATKVGTLRQFSSINNVEVGQGDQIGRILAQCPCFGSFCDNYSNRAHFGLLFATVKVNH
jgi:hypothetical protein